MEENNYYKDFLSTEIGILIGAILIGIGALVCINPALLITKIILIITTSISLVAIVNITRTVIEMVKENKTNKLQNIDSNQNKEDIKPVITKDKEFTKTYEDDIKLTEEKNKKPKQMVLIKSYKGNNKIDRD